ncbi:RHS repeat-associated core domain-containing protein [Andreprevotia lacus DSM 23236]|jgi:RHS repeat-associated protein|uniref:RHS repeat-associated core domain-containing protein n=1 Tax=Andreprevotia lacus DSM 23236 TaxID=1121001 RepID=A0A1W1XI79_9NEIS|nr:RHS repeat-associated core domain-containing protein [Andreprevotia lacus]SMC23706.1 RHS repeat-associated core domain-containing protein [Andreprevotia lacus DSM 23236]
MHKRSSPRLLAHQLGRTTAAALLAGLLFGATAYIANGATAPIAWQEGGTYTAGQQVTYNGGLYQATVNQTDYVGAGWNPAATPSLWTYIGPAPTGTPVPTATPAPTASPTPKPTSTPVPTATPTPKPTSTPVPTATPTPKPTSTPVPTATPTPKPTGTPVPTATPTPKPTSTPVPTATPTPLPTATPTPLPTATPTPLPTATPTPLPTATPQPTATPTPTSTPIPVVLPTHAPIISSFYTYDALGRVKTVMDAKGYVTAFEYDANGNRTKRTDAYNRVTKYTYDALNRLKTITDAKGKLTTLGYDANDHLVSVKDPEGFTTTYVYDGLDNLRQLISPDTGTTSYTPDAAGRTASKTDARNKTASYGYDNLGRIKTIAYGDQTHTFSYDTALNGVGRLGSFSDADGSTSYSYDALGHITQVSRTATVSGASLIQKVGYGWGNNNTLTSITYPSGATISYVWTNGAISAVQLNGKNLISNIAWSNSIGAQSWTWGNGQLWGRAADLNGRIAGATSGDTIVTHGYDNVGNISSITDTSHDSLSQAYGYDELGRLVQGTTIGVTRNYSYDGNGSRTNENHGASNTDYLHDANSNKLLNTTGSNANSYSYDASGNRANDAGMVNTYNNAGRLIQLQRGAAITQYSYNALGQRLQKTNGNGTLRYVYDEAGHLLGEYQANGSAIQETIWLGDTPIAVIKPSADPQNPSTYYVWADHLGTPRQITAAANNQLVWRWDSEAFGDTLPNQDPSNSGTTFAYNLRFPGQYYDVESGHFYNYFRDYDPATGRYVESDPIGLNGGSHSTYAYVNSTPLVSSDFYGLEEGSASNLRKRKAIDENARRNNGSQDWAYDRKKDNFPINSNKCNKFVFDMAKSADATPVINGRPPMAAEWADSRTKIPNWRMLLPSESPLPGDVAAYKLNGGGTAYSGHTGLMVQGTNNTVLNISAHGDAVYNVSGQFENQPETRYRRYTGD